MNLVAMILWWEWLIFGAVVVLTLLVAALSTLAMKGRIGERRVARRLRDGLGPEYEILNDIYLPSREGETTQIDHIVVSPYGIFVVETKNWTGWIFGDAQSAKWTQIVYRKKSSFQNPIRQNYKHICELSRNLGIDADYFIGVVVITGDCTFKTDMPDGVVYSKKAAGYIRSFRETMIGAEQISEIVQAILEWQATLTRGQIAAHVDNLKKRHEGVPASDSAPKCPYCGALMVRRVRKSDGKLFYGCSKYPACNGIVNING